MTDIRLYNTLTRTVEDFEPIKSNLVSIYTCGPTVYHYAHIGNLRAYVFADVLRRIFVSAGYEVKHVINITDVGHLVGDGDEGQDKLEKGSIREGKTVWEIAEMYTQEFFKDIELLDIPKKDYVFPRATDHITEQIELIKKLEEKGFTYRIADGIYFDTSKFAHYADFAHLNIEGLKSGARVEENKEKKNITDFALWKFSPKDEQRQMEWESPWGKGFPGWHIECSAMAMKYLGNHFDVHTGGIDLIPVHHTNEIAQSECANSEHYVNYWMHPNFLNDTTGKMSKSTGEFLRLQTLIDKGYSPLVYRYFLLMTHYRKEINFSYEALNSASVAYKKLYDFCAEHSDETGTVNFEYKKEFFDAVNDDVGTPEAIAVIWKMMKDSYVRDLDKYATLMEFNNVLGLGLHLAKKVEVIQLNDDAYLKSNIPLTSEIIDKIKPLLDLRRLAKANKDYTESDKLRDEIAKLGFIVKDGANGQELENK